MSRTQKRKVNIAAVIIVSCFCLITLILQPILCSRILRYMSSSSYGGNGFGTFPDSLPSPDGSGYEDERREENPELYADIKDLPSGSFTISDRVLTEDDVLSVSEIYEKADPSVVVIVSEYKNGSSIGTGVIMSEDGYIITNEHVISDAELVYVVLDELSYDAVIVDFDAVSDLALLKIEGGPFTPAEFGDSSILKVGAPVVSIGTPYSIEYSHTVSDGIISGIRSDVYVDNRKLELLQTNVAVNPGNSGGPLINEYGQVIGIMRSKIMTDGEDFYEGMAFAIPCEHVNTIVSGFLTGEKPVGKPLLGISIIYLDEQTAAENDMPEGAYVMTVDTDSDAYFKDIRPGDVILTLNGKSFDSTDGFVAEKDKFAPGDSVEITYWRDGDTHTVNITLVEDMS